jgi:DNA repair exonuclease SbcCD nuclease subunit
VNYPYVLSSDQHCHSWSAFSSVNPDGVNSRLRIILDEIQRAAATCINAGGDRMILAGDLFHQRGEIKPSVFNPTVQAFQKICGGIRIVAIPGNHDLEGKDADTYGNAMQALEQIPDFQVAVEPYRMGDVWVFPWYQDLDVLRGHLKAHADPDCDAVIHAPVNGVIKGIPDHGLEAAELAALGYRRVFSGHYHDHKVMEGGKVISIGATAHQTWSDPGTKAGFILVYADRIEHHESAAPQFIDLDNATIDALGDNIDTTVAGNYVRLKLTEVSEKEIKEWREAITDSGAAGCIILATKKNPATVRTGAGAASAAVSLGASIEHFIRKDMKPLLIEDVSKEAQDVLMEAQS